MSAGTFKTNLFATALSRHKISSTVAVSARRAFDLTGEWTEEEAQKILASQEELEKRIQLETYVILRELAGRTMGGV